jgi:hypothetical protein
LQTAGKSVLEKMTSWKTTKLCPFPKEMKAMCDALSNLQVDDLAAWIEVDMETPVVHLL